MLANGKGRGWDSGLHCHFISKKDDREIEIEIELIEIEIGTETEIEKGHRCRQRYTY